MPEHRGVPAKANDGLLYGGLGALLCGLALLAAGLRDDGALETVATGAPIARVSGSEADGSWLFIDACACPRPMGRAEVATATTVQPMAASRHTAWPPRGRLPGDSLGMVGWTSGDARNELLRTAILRWLREKKAWDDASGYGAVEASRVAR
jgi:hypothetical protein